MILRPLVGNSLHHIKNKGGFVDHIHNIQLQQGVYISYDVSLLFTSVPVDPAINMIRRRLEQDEELQHRTSVTVEHIISLLEFCHKTT